MQLTIPGMDGAKKIQSIMTSLRTQPPAQVGGLDVERIRDYESGVVLDRDGNKVGETPISGSNTLYFELADGSNLVARPSGTEPKLKVYTLARGETGEECADKKERITAFARALGDAV